MGKSKAAAKHQRAAADEDELKEYVGRRIRKWFASDPQNPKFKPQWCIGEVGSSVRQERGRARLRRSRGQRRACCRAVSLRRKRCTRPCRPAPARPGPGHLSRPGG